ncbi:MFS general substrate transporter [Ramicandelaber brevisporus]|nr:MFS general substrate transporter [Ramicandelaber brevisporus]
MGKDTPSIANSDADSTRELLSTSEQASLVRKVSWRIIPLISMAYWLVHLDKSNINNGRIYDLEKDLNMKPGQFGWTVSAVHFGYFFLILPTALLFRRSLHPSFWLAAIVISSGVIATGMTFVQSFGSLLALRVILGCVDSGFGPSKLFYLTQWYKRRELARTFAGYHSISLVGSIIKGFIAYGVGFIGKGADGKGWSPWRWLFLIEGLPTILVGVAMLLLLPDYPSNTKFLSERERQFATQRIEDDLKQQEIQRNLDNVNADVKEVKVDKIAEETDDDYSQWSNQILRSEIISTLTFGFNAILFTYYLCHDTVSSAFSSYLPTIIRSMGFGKVQTQLLTIPHSVLSLIIMNVVAYFSDRQGKRARYAIAGGIISAFCAMMLAILSDHSRWVRYTFLNIVNPASSAMGPILLAWAVAANTTDVVNKYKGAKQAYALKILVRIAVIVIVIVIIV